MVKIHIYITSHHTGENDRMLKLSAPMSKTISST